MDWQRLVELVVAAMVGGVAANLPRLLTLRRRAPIENRKLVAETKTEFAEAEAKTASTMLSLAQTFDLIVSRLRDELDVSRNGCQIKDEENRNLREQVALLFEQRMALTGHNLALTAALSVARGEDPLNGGDDAG